MEFRGVSEGREAVICNETQQLQSESMHANSVRKRAILQLGRPAKIVFLCKPKRQI